MIVQVVKVAVLSVLVVSAIGKLTNPAAVHFRSNSPLRSGLALTVAVSCVELFAVFLCFVAPNVIAGLGIFTVGLSFLLAHKLGIVGADCGCFGVRKDSVASRFLVKASPFVLAGGSFMWFARNDEFANRQLVELLIASVLLSLFLTAGTVYSDRIKSLANT
jgi:hypothetical protein